MIDLATDRGANGPYVEDVEKVSLKGNQILIKT